MFNQDITCPDLLNFIWFAFQIPGCHRLWPTFPDRSSKLPQTFGLVPVRSPLLGESRLISFPPGT